MASYHLRRKDRQISETEELEGLLKRGKFAVIAMSKDDEPYIVSLSYGYDAERRRLYFHCAKTGRKLDWLRANPRVCATILEDRGYVETECEHAYRSLVFDGSMQVVEEIEEKKRAIGILLAHLEKDPAPILARNIVDDASYDKVAVLRLDIGELCGKSYGS